MIDLWVRCRFHSHRSLIVQIWIVENTLITKKFVRKVLATNLCKSMKDVHETHDLMSYWQVCRISEQLQGFVNQTMNGIWIIWFIQNIITMKLVRIMRLPRFISVMMSLWLTNDMIPTEGLAYCLTLAACLDYF